MAFIINELFYCKQNVYIRFLYMTSYIDEDHLYKLKDKYDKSDTDFDNYLLWHYQFVYFDSVKLRDLYKVIILKKQIIISVKKEVCEVCEFIKMRKWINHQVGSRKIRLLKSVLVNICGLLPIFLSRMRYFMEIVDQWSRCAWVYLIRNKKDAIRLF